jgi:hypothetical protein
VRRLALALFTSLQLASLCGQTTDDLPAIGTCATNALRIRSFPSLKEGASSVVGMDGAIGWSFGGYIDIGTAKLRVFAGSDEDLEVESEASDALASEGGACRRLRASAAGMRGDARYISTAGRPRRTGIRPTARSA